MTPETERLRYLKLIFDGYAKLNGIDTKHEEPCCWNLFLEGANAQCDFDYLLKKRSEPQT